MTKPRDFFAQAERLAVWAYATLGARDDALRALLADWRDDNAIPLSDDALSIITLHQGAPVGAST